MLKNIENTGKTKNPNNPVGVPVSARTGRLNEPQHINGIFVSRKEQETFEAYCREIAQDMVSDGFELGACECFDIAKGILMFPGRVRDFVYKEFEPENAQIAAEIVADYIHL